MVFASPLPDVEIPDQALTEYVLENAARLGDKPALIDGPTGRTITYAGLAAAAHSFAGGLTAKGFGKGDVLALMSPNIPEYAVIFHGVALVGGVITTINPTYTHQEVHKQLVDSGATIMVTIPMFLEVAQEGSVGTSVQETYVLGEAEGVKLAWKPNLKTEVSVDDAATLLKLIDVLDDDDDVQTVWGNYEISDDVMAKLG